MKKVLLSLVVVLILLTGCREADKVSTNISREADEFRVQRRIVFYNSITDTYMLEVVGNCAVDLGRSNVLELTCKIADKKYQKHYLGLSDNVTYTIEQLEFSDVNPYKYQLIFKPESIFPITIDVE